MSTGGTMQRSLKLASQLGRIITVEPTHWGLVVQAAMALTVIVLCTLTVAALETSLLGDESLSALEATWPSGRIDDFSTRGELRDERVDGYTGLTVPFDHRPSSRHIQQSP